MTIEYKQSLSELYFIINCMNQEVSRRIPASIINFIKENMDSKYVPNINKAVPLNEQDLKENTKALISIIYRDYLCNAETREMLTEKEQLEGQILDSQKIGLESLFNKPIIEQNCSVTAETSIVNIQQKWYKKLFNAIIAFFKLNK